MQNTDVARRIELGPTRSTRGRRLYHPYKRTPSPLAQRQPRDAAWDVPGADWTSAVAVVEEDARDGVLDAFEVGHSPSSTRRRYVVDASSVQYTALWHRLNPGLPNADAQEHVAQGGEAGAFKVDHTRPLALPTRRSRVPLRPPPPPPPITGLGRMARRWRTGCASACAGCSMGAANGWTRQHDVDGDEEAGAVLQAAMAPHAGVPVRPAFVRRRLATVIIVRHVGALRARVPPLTGVPGPRGSPCAQASHTTRAGRAHQPCGNGGIPQVNVFLNPACTSCCMCHYARSIYSICCLHTGDCS
jgi:hypothetical protein